MERLGRGIIALRTSTTQVYVGWRLLGNDSSDIGFNLYRSANGGAAVMVNSAPLTNTTDYRNGAITLRWTRDFNTLMHEASGHQIRIADPDNDGKDEYLDFGHGLDDDGTQLYAINAVGHGDRYTVGDIDPDRPGLETYII
jgi:hypothetical protein